MEANLGLVQTLKLYEVAKYMTANVNLWPFPTVLVMNQAKFDALSADQQATITAAAAKVPGFSIEHLHGAERAAGDALQRGPQVRGRQRRGPRRLQQGLAVGDHRALQERGDQGLHRPDPGTEGRAAGASAPPAPLPEGCTVTS